MEQRITGRDSYGLGAQGVVSDTQILSLYSYVVFDVNTVKDVVALGWHLSWHHFTSLPWAPTPQASGCVAAALSALLAGSTQAVPSAREGDTVLITGPDCVPTHHDFGRSTVTAL